MGALLADKARLNPGDHVALIFPPGIELVAAFYGCLSAGQIYLLFSNSEIRILEFG